MIKLIRSFIVTGDWEPVAASFRKQKALYEEKYPQVKSFSVWSGVTGRVDRMSIEMTFESLAEEESWATAVMQDPAYMEAGMPMWENTKEFTDKLYRMMEDPES